MSYIVYFLNFVLLTPTCAIVMTAAFAVLCVLFFVTRKIMPSLMKKILICLLAVCVAYFLFIAWFILFAGSSAH